MTREQIVKIEEELTDLYMDVKRYADKWDDAEEAGQTDRAARYDRVRRICSAKIEGERDILYILGYVAMLNNDGDKVVLYRRSEEV